jgi:hypothetical protein
MTQEQAINLAKEESLKFFRMPMIVYFDTSTADVSAKDEECFHYGPDRAWRILSPYGEPRFRIVGNQVTPL